MERRSHRAVGGYGMGSLSMKVIIPSEVRRGEGRIVLVVCLWCALLRMVCGFSR
jgi:hypothetical protein